MKLIIILSILIYSNSFAARFEGKLLEKGTRTPLADTNIFILPQKIKTITDPNGNFVLENIPVGKFQWVVNRSGYKKLEYEDEIETSEENQTFQKTLYLEKNSYLVYETTVYGRGQKRDTSIKTMKQEQFLKMPGSGGDPIKAVQNTAGVNRPNSFQSQIIIQGSGPQDTKYMINDHEVPIIFHFGGLSSVVMPEAVESVDLFQAGYGPEYGRAQGGLVGLNVRNPRKDRTHMIAYMDFFNAGALIEGTFGESSGYLLSARRAYFGSTLRTVFKNNSDFNLTAAPTYTDVTGLYTTDLTKKDHFTFTAVGSDDLLEFVLRQPLKQDPSIRGEFQSKIAFFRLIPELEHKHSDSTISRYSLGLGRDFQKFNSAENYFKLRTYQLTARGELEQQQSKVWRSFIGFDNRYNWARLDISFPNFVNAGGVPNPLSSGERRTATISNNAVQIGGYWRNTLKWENSNWTYLPNIRFDWFKNTNEYLFQPRPAIRYAWDETLTLRGATGLYYQQPLEQEVDSTFGNPDIKSPHALHLTIGAEKDFRGSAKEGWITSLDTFYKNLYDVVIPSSKVILKDTKRVFENYNNEGTGRVYGAQASIKYDFSPWKMGLNYTLSRSTRWTPTQNNYPYQYDQTHNVGVVGSFELENWEFGARFRYATGNPYTPVVGGTWDADADVYVPKRGAFYSQRLEPFYQLDLRIDKKWIYNTWILSLYLDIQNVTNHQNLEQVVYSYDYSKKEQISSLPILPTLGVKGEF